MEFNGRIKKLLPMRGGKSARTGNEWKALPFIFEYFEHDTDRWADSVLLETFDEKVINNLKEGMEVKCGFSHHTRKYEGRTFNELRLYKIESIKTPQQPAQAMIDPPTGNQPQTEQNAPTAQENGGQGDDLPF